MSTLVVYFSRTGTTRNVAEALARKLGADLEAIREPRGRLGRLGYVRSALDASLSRWVPTLATERDPARYDLVIVGGPVWFYSLSAPVRSFLASHCRQLQEVAFFVTEGGEGHPRVFRQMGEVSGAVPVATLALTRRDFARGDSGHAIDRFVASLPRNATSPSTQAHAPS